jgi:hypothetical protein
MSIKDLFNRSSQVVVSSSLEKIAEDIESPQYIQEYDKDVTRVEPHIDFSNPANFSTYGSAEEYYLRSLEYIYDEYPYDGSLKERIQWKKDATLLDLYILDNKYPKSTGYGILASDGWGTLTGSLSGGYGAPATGDYEYINIKGGPNSIFGASLGTSSLADVFDSKSNVFDETVTGSNGPVSAQMSTNLQANLARGVTVELWLQTGSLDTALTEKQVVFDLWNGELSSSAGYGRIRIEMTGSGAPFLVTVLSGTTGFHQQSIGSTLTQNSLSDWAHYAFSFVNTDSNIITRLYRNGELNQTLTAGTNIGEIREDIEANIGALVATPSGNVYHGAAIGEGWGKLSGSIDEFRFWKTRRTEKQIKRNYFTNQIGGGTNTDTANLDLGVYYKFNEGITTNTTTDSVVLDYSGRISNGTWEGYPSSNARNTGSAINSASAGTEDLDVIVRLNHPDVYNLRAELQESGSNWDRENNSSIFFTLPSWIIDEDEGNGTTGNTKKLTQIMASYLDNLDLLIGEMPKFSMASYPSSSVGLDGQPDKLHKLYPYGQRAVSSFGLDAPELFSNKNFLEYYKNRNETKEYEEELYTIKNVIYNNIFNNLTDIYKAKGTEKSFRNLIRCFGVGDDVIRINAYSDNGTYKFDTKRRADSVRSKAINLNHVDNFAGTVYQYADSSNANSVSHISGSGRESLTLEDGFPMTLEAEVVFPEKISMRLENSYTQEYPYLTASLFGMHQARANSPTETDLTWAATDNANFQVFAIRDEVRSSDVKFMLSSSVPFPIPELTSSQYYNVYENQKWNFAVRIKPLGYPQSFASGAVDNNYVLEFYGVNYIADRKINEFTITGSIGKQAAENLLISPKRIFVGSHKTNFTGSTLHYSDTKITACRYWFDYIDDETMRTHAIDPDNFGLLRPARDTYIKESDLANVQVPEIESLALYWDFQTVTGSDNGSGSPATFDGKFVVEDVTSGSLGLIGRYNWLGKILKYQHTGRGDAFPINSTGSVENLFLYSGKQQLPEVVFGDDNIRVLNREETEVFTKETRPVKTYYAFEKSMYQIISDEIVNYFGSIAEFNNLIGEPVHRYRQSYKSMEYLRQFFFERVGNTPDLDKFVEFYKWIDSTLETMLMQLVPASAQVSDGIDNVVESHILERNKYWSKFPTMEFSASAPEGGVVTINRHLYDWEHGHRPISGLQSDNCFYWKERAERDDDPISSGDTGVDADRNSILDVSLQVLNRKFNTPYRFGVSKRRQLHGGINYSENKKTNFYRGINYPHGPVSALGLPLNELNAYNVNVTLLKDCNDDIIPPELQKKKYSFGTRNGRAYDSGSLDGVKGEIAMPFNILSASSNIGGYNAGVQANFLANSQLVNLHSDAYGDRNETPMQGPFTEKYVGGHQHRHVRINNFDANRIGGDGAAGPNNLDGQFTRPEAWRLLLGGGPSSLGAIGLTGPDYGGPYPDPTRQRAWWWREETAKRPVNIRNILQTTASADTVLSGTLQFGAIGNYEKTYQVLQTSGRSTNNFWFNDGQTDLLPARFKTNNPKTTNVHTLIGIRPNNSARKRGNTFIPGTTSIGASPYIKGLNRNSNLYEPKDGSIPAGSVTKPTVFTLPDRTKQDAVIVERFSAPGGPEISSLGFLDVVAAEKSVYNALPFRNLSVRGSGSGEDINALVGGGSIRVSDHLGHRRGLRTLAALHAGQFGSDATYGSIVASTYNTSPSFYKINRNTGFKIGGVPGTPGSSYSTASVRDNFHVQHPIPQNDKQYSWITASISNTGSFFGHAPRSGLISGSNAFQPAIAFLSASEILTSTGDGSPSFIDFVGTNATIFETTSSFNLLTSSDNSAADNLFAYAVKPFGTQNDAPGGTFTGTPFTRNKNNIFNALMLNRNGPYGYSSWRQVSNRYHPIVRQMRANNSISIIDPDTERESLLKAQGKYRGYEWDGLKNNIQLFGYTPRKPNGQIGASTFRLTQDRTILEFREPVVISSYRPIEFSGKLAGVPAEVKASYANQKTNFSNSKLNQKLGLTEDNSTAADNVYSMFAADGNQLVNLVYSEQVYPAKTNINVKRNNQRTTFKNDFWRDQRIDRKIALTGSVFGFRQHNLGEGTYTSSLWSLDARLDFINTDTPGVKTARHDVFDDSDPISGSGTGILQNVSVIFHSGKDGAQPGPPGPQIITASCLYSRPHGLTTGSSVRLKTSPLGTSIGDALGILQHRNAVQFSGDAPWDAGKQSGLSPFYDSYDAYIKEMKLVGKDYSIVPEYRMSERMEDYLINGVDKFNDTKLFNLTGALANITSSNQNDFYKIYSHSDFTKYFGVVKNDVATKTNLPENPSQITVRCQALLKLLPYDGFYPASRTVQLSRLFSGSYAQNFSLTRLDSGNPTFVAADRRQAAMRAIFAPVIAPGVLYNTIKSGIAVDYPVLTSSVLITASVKASNGTENGADLTNNQSGEDFYIANNYFDYRVPFEALAQPEEYISNISFSDMEPHPSASLATTASWDGNGDNRFKFAMNNFLAETPEFFLQNGNFVSFISSPEENFQKAKANRKYTMKVALRRSFVTTQNQFDPDIRRYPFDPGRGRQNMVMYSRPSAFGPPILGALSGVVGVPVSSSDDLSSTGYDAAPNSSVGASAFSASGSMFGGSNFGINGPFTPPYYHGGAYVIFEFNPTESKKYTLEEIQSQVTISYHRFPNWNLTGALGADGPMGGPGTFGTASFQVENRAETNSMQISASVNLLGRVSAKDLFKFQNVDLTGGDRWVIQTKFETPILNFIDVSSSAGLTPIGSNTTGSAAVSGGINTRPFGMWHQYGRLPQGEEGVFLEISKPKFRPLIVESSDSDGNFTNPVGSAPRSDLSLASLIGFNATSQKLGQVAETKTIREAVVAVPFVEEDNKRKFFEISRAALIAQSSTEGGTVFSTNVDSIQQMMDSMERYVMPPSFDFLTYPDDATPVTMYIFEFEHALNQQDLTNIWQNLPPRIARAFDPDNGLETSQIKQTKEITHSLGDRELLADVEDKLQWMVFKVKQRAKTNYFEKVIESNSKTDIPESLQGQGLGQTLSKKNAKETDFLGGGAAKGANTLESEDTIGYNWPYDFFSLVELAKIDEDVVFGTPVAVTVDQDFDASTITQGDGGFTMPTKKVSKTVVEQIADQATGGFTQDNVQNSFKTETTKTVATQVDPSNNNQLVRTGVVAKEESSSTNPVDSTAFPTTPTKSVSKEVNKDSTIVMTKEETTTEMTSDDSKQVSDSVDKNFKL